MQSGDLSVFLQSGVSVMFVMLSALSMLGVVFGCPLLCPMVEGAACFLGVSCACLCFPVFFYGFKLYLVLLLS